MRSLICILCLCFLLPGCTAKRTSASRGDKLVAASDSWQTNKIIIKAAEDSGNLDVALVAATSEITSRPENTEARVIMARLLTRSGQAEQALITLEPIKKATPESSLETARAELSLGHSEKVGPLLEQAEKGATPRTLAREVKKLRAVSLDIAGDHKAAQGLYRNLLGDNDEMGVRYNYGRSLIASGDYGQAVSMLLPLAELHEMPQARAAAAAAMAKNKDINGARNLLHGYMSEADIDRVVQGEKI